MFFLSSNEFNLAFSIEIIWKVYHPKCLMNWTHYSFCEFQTYRNWMRIRDYRSVIGMFDNHVSHFVLHWWWFDKFAWKSKRKKNSNFFCLCGNLFSFHLTTCMNIILFIWLWYLSILSNNQLVHLPLGIFHHEFTHLQLLWVCLDLRSRIFVALQSVHEFQQLIEFRFILCTDY